MKTRRFLRSALWLTLSAFLTRLLSMGYRIFLTGRIGAEGIGLYQLIDTVFVFAVTVSTAGISLSVSKIITAALSSNQKTSVRVSIRRCVLFSLLLSFLAMAGLLCASGWIGTVLLRDSRIVLPLRILSFGLPFMASCACMKGYFLAKRAAGKTAAGEVLEQLVTIGVAVFLFLLFSPKTTSGCCCAVVVGSTLGEAASCLFSFILYRMELRKRRLICQGSSGCTARQLCRTILPITLSSALRSGLTVLENIFLPIGLRKYGAGSKSALSEYGILGGMVLPMLFFPSVLLLPFSSLLVPEMTEALTQNRSRTIRRIADQSLRITLLYALFVSAFFLCFSRELGLLFYHSAESALLLRLLAPMVPLWYLDFVVDGLLKGLDQQLASLRYNFLDASLRVCLVCLLIPITGTKGYVLILYCSGIVNAILSIRRLTKTARLPIPLFRYGILPLFASLAAVFPSAFLFCRVPFLTEHPAFLLITALFLSAAAYFLLLRFLNCITKEDVSKIKNLFSGIKKQPRRTVPHFIWKEKR